MCVSPLTQGRYRGCFHGDARRFGRAGFGFREDEHWMNSPGAGSAANMCPQQPLPARFCSSSLTLFDAQRFSDSLEIRALVALFFGQLCWQLFFPPKRRGTEDVWLTEFSVCPCVPGTCLPKDPPGVHMSGGIALFFGVVWL